MINMKSNLEVLAIIPARGGSKSIPGKNIRIVGGKPLIAHSIIQALESRLISRVICSTDDKEIANVARKYGAEVPFMRPDSISGDYAVDFDFHLHALRWLEENEDYVPELIVQLRPTNPFRTVETIDRAIETLIENPQADSLRGIRPCTHSPYKMWRKKNNGFIKPILTLENENEPYNMPRQKLPTVYEHDGYIDITRSSVVLEMNSTTGQNILPFLIDEETVDIDYENDLINAENIFLNNQDTPTNG